MEQNESCLTNWNAKQSPNLCIWHEVRTAGSDTTIHYSFCGNTLALFAWGLGVGSKVHLESSVC
jgi:hypothetical protein